MVRLEASFHGIVAEGGPLGHKAVDVAEGNDSKELYMAKTDIATI